ncbi:MAG: hypothetical protein HQ478_16405 [Chloroflexi bacterium]|nr:hypothetical protein [Chloroflexota bacterium]
MLIFLRRIIAVVLMVVFFALFLATLLIGQVQNTIGNPAQLKTELIQSDIYNFVYDDLAIPLIADALENPEDFLNDDLADLEIRPDEDAEQIVGLLRDFLPPEELQWRIEHVIDEFIPYITGDTDEFAIQLQLEARVEEWPNLLQGRLDALQVGERLTDAVLAPALEDALKSLSDQGLELTITSERAIEIAQDIAPPDWIETQVVAASRAVADYLTRTDEEFTITIQFSDRVPRVTQALKDVLDEANAEGFLFDELIEPELKKALGSFTEVSHGIEISDQDIKNAIEAVAPAPWVREQRNNIIDNVSAYISSESDSLAIEVDLEERAATAASELIDLAVQKLTTLIDDIPACTSVSAALTAASDIQLGSFPSCVPGGVSGSLLINTLAAPFEDEIQNLIVSQIPASFTFTEDDLTQLVGDSSIETINDIRRWVSDGFTYTESDLRLDIAEQNSDFTLDDLEVIRDNLDDDKVFTQVDFTERVLQGRASQQANFDRIRDGIGRGRDLWMLVFILPGFVLLLIAFLGGRNWGSRLRWAMFPVLISGVAIWVATAPVYDRFAADGIDELIVTATKDLDRQSTIDLVIVAINRGVEIAERWKDDFGSKALQFAIGAGVIFVLSILLGKIMGGKPKRKPRGPVGKAAKVNARRESVLDELRNDTETTRLEVIPDDPD